MDLYGCHFEFGGTSSRMYSLIFANTDTERYVKLVGDSKSKTIFSKIGNKNYLIKDDYTDSPIVFDAEIVTDDQTVIGKNDRRKIEKWLFNKPYYSKLFIDMDDDCNGETYDFIDGVQKRLYLNCRFVNPEKLEYNGGVIGYKFSVECDSFMSWQEPVSHLYVRSGNGVGTTIVNVDSDISDYIYPDVKISVGSNGGDILITNATDENDRITKIISATPNELITLKGSINYISGDNFSKFDGRNFVRLLDGENAITIIGDVNSIEFTWQNRRYL